MTIQRRSAIKWGAGLLSIGLSPALLAQPAAPTGAVTIVIPYQVGGAVDFFTRTITEKMGEKLGQPVIAENKPGATTSIAALDVARAKPDGSRLLMGDLSTFATNASLYKKLSYDASRDFAPVSLTGRFPFLLVVNPNVLPYATVGELVAAAKKAPGTISYASSGNGNALHLTAAMFERTAGVQLVHVPYKGTGAALPDLLGGQIGMAFMDYASARGHLASGKLRALGVTSLKPIAALPTVAPIANTYPGFEVFYWQGLVAPRATPAATVARLREAYFAAVSDASVRKKIEEAGIEPLQSTGPEMEAFMRSESERWGKVIQDARIELDP